jgi:hypothetical protein
MSSSLLTALALAGDVVITPLRQSRSDRSAARLMATIITDVASFVIGWLDLELEHASTSTTREIVDSLTRLRAELIVHRAAPPAWMFERTGLDVDVRRDDGSVLQTFTRSVPWQLGHGQWVVKVDGIAGGYDVTRVTRRV